MTDRINNDSVQRFGVEVGELTSPEGLTRVDVDREGTFVVVHESMEVEPDGEKEREDQSEVQRDEVRGDIDEFIDVGPDQLFAWLGAVPIEDDFPSRLGLPDEPILRIIIEREGEPERRVVRMWLRDAESDPDVAPLLESMRTLVEGSTDGRRFL